jgi:tRNA (guanine37-N1)-methyltransferase
MKFTFITIFPQIVEAFASHGLIGQARNSEKISIETLNPRQFTEDAHHTVDDRTFGGGDGMVMKYEPLAKAVENLKGRRRVFVLSPQGRPWNQEWAMTLSEEKEAQIVLVCGRYAGIDNRFVARYAVAEISIGDFILSGGEVAACAVLESVARLVPGVLGNHVSADKDSFMDGLLECPQFTRPREVGDLPVPSVLLSGNHAAIQSFESDVARVRTALLRPDLLSIKDVRRETESLLRLSDLELASLGLKREQMDIFRE